MFLQGQGGLDHFDQSKLLTDGAVSTALNSTAGKFSLQLVLVLLEVTSLHFCASKLNF